MEDAHDPEGVIESLANRAAYAGKSLRSLIHGGFYGPVNRGELPGAIARIETDEKLKARLQSGIDAVWGGANRLKGATDLGMARDPNAKWAGGLITPGAIYNDWGGGPGGHAGAARFREQLRRQVASGGQRPDLLVSAAKAGVGGIHKVEGSADLKVAFENAPAGAKAYMQYGGMFKSGTVDWDHPMPASNPGGGS